MGNCCRSKPSFDALKYNFEKAGQGHVFQNVKKVDESNAELIDQAARIDPTLVTSLYKNLVLGDHTASVGELEPVEAELVFSVEGKRDEMRRAFDKYLGIEQEDEGTPLLDS